LIARLAQKKRKGGRRAGRQR